MALGVLSFATCAEVGSRLAPRLGMWASPSPLLRYQKATLLPEPEPFQKIGLDDYLVAGGCVEDLETFTLDGQTFRSASFWYGRWKMKTMAVAA